jgi:hypothetical protein
MPKKMKTECVEGPKALENFEKLAKAVFHSPRLSILKNLKKKTSSHKTKNCDKDYKGICFSSRAPVVSWRGDSLLPVSLV